MTDDDTYKLWRAFAESSDFRTERASVVAFARALLAAAPAPQQPTDDERHVAVVVSSGAFEFPLLQWRSAEHSLNTPIGTKLYAAPQAQPAAPARGPLTEEQRREFVTEYFAEEWAVEKALVMLHDYDRGIGAAAPAAQPSQPVKAWGILYNDVLQPTLYPSEQAANAELNLRRTECQHDDGERKVIAVWSHSAAPAAQPVPEGETHWALRLPGPDDLHAAPSREEAERVAAAFNPKMRAAYEKSATADWPPVEASLAEVVQWPWDAAEHAEAVKDWNPTDWGAASPSKQKGSQ